MFRELHEELGLTANDVQIISETRSGYITTYLTVISAALSSRYVSVKNKNGFCSNYSVKTIVLNSMFVIDLNLINGDGWIFGFH